MTTLPERFSFICSIKLTVDKTLLRRNLLQTRKLIPFSEWKHKSDRICSHLLNSPQLNQAKTVLAYFSFRCEPDISQLFANNQYQWGVPRCVGKSLFWHRYQHNDTLVTGAYGIAEPNLHAPVIKPQEVDLIIVPCVACDSQGYRLGYGGGYYDRLLSSPEWETKFTIGILFDFAYLPQLPIEPWDKPLQAICTETDLLVLK
jgi:5-formyltetrahydrofolate cyclo-ligase